MGEIYHHNTLHGLRAHFFRQYIKKPYGVDFTETEMKIFNLIMEENSSKKISKKLKITVSAVKRHRESILLKTNSKSMDEVIIKYYIRDIIE